MTLTDLSKGIAERLRGSPFELRIDYPDPREIRISVVTTAFNYVIPVAYISIFIDPRGGRHETFGANTEAWEDYFGPMEVSFLRDLLRFAELDSVSLGIVEEQQ